MLLHHFSELVCSSLAMFDLQPRVKEHAEQGSLVALDALRGVLIPSGKVRTRARHSRGRGEAWRPVFICRFVSFENKRRKMSRETPSLMSD